LKISDNSDGNYNKVFYLNLFAASYKISDLNFVNLKFLSFAIILYNC